MEPAAVMVTGGSGYVGQQVVRRLAEKGRTVVAVYHHKLPEALDNVYPVCADFNSPELMAAPLRGVETVVHLAWEGGLAGPPAPFSFVPQSYDGLTNNLRILRHLLAAMERAGTRRLILMSASGAAANSESRFLQEKYAAESLVLNSRIAEKVILRSSVIWGGQAGNDRFLRTLLRVIKYPVYPLPRRTGRIAPIHVRDLADTVALACACTLPTPVSLLDVQGGENYQLQDVFKIVSESFGRRARIPLGGFLGKSLLPLLERDPRSATTMPKLQHFLCIGGRGDSASILADPLTAMLPKPIGSFKDRVLE